MELEDLRTFIEVVDAGGVAPGARRLGVAKSVVSRRLARLESALGAQLLARTTRGSVLTDEGGAFREHAMRIVAEMDGASEALSPSGEVRGSLRVAAPVSFGPTRLAPVFSELARRHPRLQIDTSYSDRFVDVVGEGFDCAVRLGLLPDSSLVARRITGVRIGLFASPAYLADRGTPRRLVELPHHDAVAKRGEIWTLLDDRKVVTIRPRARFYADNGEALLAAALSGLGIVALPRFLTELHVEAGRLVPLLDDYPVPPAGMYVVRPPGAFVSRKVRALIDILLEAFGDEPAVGPNRRQLD